MLDEECERAAGKIPLGPHPRAGAVCAFPGVSHAVAAGGVEGCCQTAARAQPSSRPRTCRIFLTANQIGRWIPYAQANRC